MKANANGQKSGRKSKSSEKQGQMLEKIFFQDITRKLEVASSPFVQQFVYFIAVSSQVTLYCWYGNEITLAGLSVPFAIYSAEWFFASPSFKRGMLINMMRMNREMFVTIGKFSPLTISTLVAIFRGSYSYFAVLHNKNNE